MELLERGKNNEKNEQNKSSFTSFDGSRIH